MKIRVGIMGSAETSSAAALDEPASALGRAVAAHDLILLTGATTGVVYAAGKAAHTAGAFHIGVSPASNHTEHVQAYGLPVDACDAIIHTGFGLKGRNVILVRSCQIVIFVAGSIGSLNEFTIAFDEGKIIGCLTGTGGVADEASRLLATLEKESAGRIFYDSDPQRLLDACLQALEARGH
jgi:uncharacterized protein (TIGR00725 family)